MQKSRRDGHGGHVDEVELEVGIRAGTQVADVAIAYGPADALIEAEAIDVAISSHGGSGEHRAIDVVIVSKAPLASVGRIEPLPVRIVLWVLRGQTITKLGTNVGTGRHLIRHASFIELSGNDGCCRPSLHHEGARLGEGRAIISFCSGGEAIGFILDEARANCGGGHAVAGVWRSNRKIDEVFIDIAATGLHAKRCGRVAQNANGGGAFFAVRRAKSKKIDDGGTTHGASSRQCRRGTDERYFALRCGHGNGADLVRRGQGTAVCRATRQLNEEVAARRNAAHEV